MDAIDKGRLSEDELLEDRLEAQVSGKIAVYTPKNGDSLVMFRLTDKSGKYPFPSVSLNMREVAVLVKNIDKLRDLMFPE